MIIMKYEIVACKRLVVLFCLPLQSLQTGVWEITSRELIELYTHRDDHFVMIRIACCGKEKRGFNRWVSETFHIYASVVRFFYLF